MSDDEYELSEEEEAAEAYARGLQAQGIDPETDDFARLQKRLNTVANIKEDAEISKEVNIALSTDDRVAIYNDVLGMLQSGEKPQHIAAHVVGILNDHITRKMNRARKRKRGKSPMFRRVDS